MTRSLLTTLVFAAFAALLALPVLAQSPTPPGIPSPGEAGNTPLGEVNIYVIAAVVLSLVAIALALVFRKKPEHLQH